MTARSDSTHRAAARLVPGRELPGHAFVPGRTARPPAAERIHRTTVEPGTWSTDAEYLWGVDLFNHGFPWEAHEAWEPLWGAAPPRSPERMLLQGLIQAAAAIVKAMAEQPAGVVSLVATASDLLDEVAATTAPHRRFMGVDAAGLAAALRAWAAGDHAAAAAPTIELANR